jgi:hypothetical protein
MVLSTLVITSERGLLSATSPIPATAPRMIAGLLRNSAIKLSTADTMILL